MRLDGAVLLPLGAEFTLNHQVRLAESLFHIADFFQDVSGKIVLGVVNAGGIGLIMNYRARHPPWPARFQGWPATLRTRL